VEKEEEADGKRRRKERMDIGKREWRNEEEERKRKELPSPPAGILPNLLHQADGLPSCGRRPTVVLA